MSNQIILRKPLRASFLIMKYIVLTSIILFAQIALSQSKKGFELQNSIIPVAEIKDGGPPKDGIPSIDKPVFLPAAQGNLQSGDRVLGIMENGIAKAYPIKIMNYHEIVNDEFEGKPVVVTYCPLCGSGIAFDAVVDGKTLEFGVSGLLYNSDVLLYDRETESLWSQLEFKAISGPMAGKELSVLNTANTTWKNWKEKYPETLVLSEKTGFIRDYSIDPYPGYEDSSTLFFPVSTQNNEFHPKEMIIGITENGKSKAYPFSELEKTGKISIKDNLNGKILEIRYDSESKSAEILDENGKPIPAITNFWFAWFAFNPDTEIYRNK